MNYGKKATMQLLRKYDNKSSKVKNKFKLIVLKILLVVVIVAGAAGISSGIGVMKGIIDSAPDISKIDVTPTGYSTTVLAANGFRLFMLMTEALRLNVLYLLVPIEYTSLLMRYRKIFNMLLLQSRMNAFTTTTASTCMVSEEPLSPVCQRADSVREPAQ